MAIVVLILGRKGNVFGLQFGAMVAMLLFLGIPLAWIGVAGVLPLASDFAYTSLSNASLADGYFLFYLCAASISSVITLALLSRVVGFVRFSTASKASIRRDTIAMVLSVAVYLLGTLTVYLYSINSLEAHWYRSREEFVQTMGTAGIVVSYMTTGARLMVIGSIARLAQQRGFTALVAVISGVFSIYDVLITGNRIGLLLMVFCFLVVAVSRRQYRLLVAGLIAAPLLAYVLSLYAYVRPYLYSGQGIEAIAEASAANISQSTEGLSSIFLGGIESVNISVIKKLYEADEQIPQQFGATYARPILIPVPRSVWPSKPQSPTVLAGEMFAGGNTSLVVTFIGEGLINFGRIGFLLGLFLVVVSIRGFAFFFKEWGANGIFQAMLGFLSIRMAFSDLILWGMGALAIWIISGYLSRMRLRRRNSAHVPT
jgi:hypothetical protein